MSHLNLPLPESVQLSSHLLPHFSPPHEVIRWADRPHRAPLCETADGGNQGDMKQRMELWYPPCVCGRLPPHDGERPILKGNQRANTTTDGTFVLCTLFGTGRWYRQSRTGYKRRTQTWRICIRMGGACIKFLLKKPPVWTDQTGGAESHEMVGRGGARTGWHL